ncbi:prolyl 4-hydroxylase 1 isoform X2 [Cucurbita maxima]|uniref:Prolyl 4-hydroxylase 1 isoform X2 n=1 Tax=Cucurbita maxima TaxID=3661 RepID=A0A6J1IS22_CUCMA|nr:prolyl 4-hydroxylase 1 isoform X2 [Cucurbita maxima]
MASVPMRIAFGLLTFVTVGMIIGALFQLAFIRRLEDSTGNEFLPAGRLHKTQYDSHHQLPRGLPNWINDKEAEILRLGYVKPEVVSWSPRIIVLHNFLSPEGVKSDFRTSSGMFLGHRDKKFPMVQAIEKRISVYSQIPIENGEFIQVLRYEKSQFYKPHHDYFSDTYNLMRGGQRIATMLMYLSENVEGGETYFPKAGSGECSCGGKTVPGLSVKPVRGDAVLFWSMGLDGQSDPNSIHGGCEVLSGEKWSATKWMRQKSTLVRR